MNILGITGGTLGGAALVRDGRVVAAVHEERLNRLKSSQGFPWQSIREVLDLGGIGPGEVDVVAHAARRAFLIAEPHEFDGWLAERPASGRRVTEAVTMSTQVPDPIQRLMFLLGKSDTLWKGAQMARIVATLPNRSRIRSLLRGRLGITAPLETIDHHHAHAYGAYYTAGRPEATVITLDGGGDGFCSKVYRARGGSLHRLDGTTTFHSIGNYYAYVTKILGYKAQLHEGKITGLAAHGEPRFVELLRGFIDYDARRDRFVNRGGRMLWAAIDQLRAALPPAYPPEDLAASIQQLLEEAVTAFVARWVRETGLPHVVLSGGVFANVKVNQRIHELPEVESVTIHPAMTDAGLGVGAAFGSYARRPEASSHPFADAQLEQVYLGPSWDQEAMSTALRDAELSVARPGDLEARVAELLAQGAIVARYDGAMEYGPRALGNRSILYQATDASVNDWLNKRLHRTEFMPFAPVTLADSAGRCYRNLEGAEYTARFMTITFDCTEWMKREMPAVVHVDGTARPQLLDRETNPSYFRILERYERLTGLNSIVNTSFNMHEEPIVCSPEDAVRGFLEAKLDYLAMGPFLAARDAESLQSGGREHSAHPSMRDRG
ncbi:MAG TPA: carbamoyltransferase C-terminal domain-containing protein [Gemmatimonadota bacterium]|nr:carbamoyltransferase C-terminal domain-containing protein [Gemmatimonadota bacterium]